jgi:hypothetical protein
MQTSSLNLQMLQVQHFTGKSAVHVSQIHKYKNKHLFHVRPSSYLKSIWLNISKLHKGRQHPNLENLCSVCELFIYSFFFFN